MDRLLVQTEDNADNISFLNMWCQFLNFTTIYKIDISVSND
jgi:hypothetical protein